MANKQFVNKVGLADGTILIDITDTTAEPSDVAAGEVFYTKSGARSVGTGALNIIDDTAGEGDTDKTWSADKLYDFHRALRGIGLDIEDGILVIEPVTEIA